MLCMRCIPLYFCRTARYSMVSYWKMLKHLSKCMLFILLIMTRKASRTLYKQKLTLIFLCLYCLLYFAITYNYMYIYIYMYIYVYHVYWTVSQLVCQTQINVVKEKKIFYDYHRRKRSEKNEVIPVETQGMLIVNKLRTQYMEELVRDIKRQQEEYQ